MAVAIRVRDSEILREGVPLLGVYDGVNVLFTTPEVFVQSVNRNIKVYLNGVRLFYGSGNDYVVQESGGPGTGFDTVVLVVAPKATENLLADYRIK
jgi:hypothetical protein